MNKEELLKEISKTKEHLANMEKMLKECDERWKPKDDDKYFIVDRDNKVTVTTWHGTEFDNRAWNICNCFKTFEEASQEAEKILTRRQLETIAKELNGNRQIDWNWPEQDKYCIAYNAIQKQLYCSSSHCHQVAGVVYSISPCFLEEAIKEIGEEQLKVYIIGDI